MNHLPACWFFVAVSFVVTPKTEPVMHEDYRTRRQPRQSLFGYVEVFYNRRQRHAGSARRNMSGMAIKFDWISVLLIGALIATLLAFFAGVFPYPYGWIVITALLVFRLTAVRQRKE